MTVEGEKVCEAKKGDGNSRMDVITGRAAAGSTEMEYVRFGSGERTLVILPGLSVQSVIPAAQAIAKQYEIFGKDFTAYLFDRRSVLPARYPVEAMADDTAAVMRALGLKNVCLFGASQGGMMAEVIAVKYPDLVGKLALGSTACRIDGTRAAVIGEWTRLAGEGKAEELYLSFGKSIYPESVFTQYRGALAAMSKSVTAEDLKRFVILAEGTAGFDIKDELAQIRCPVLAIGDHTDAVLGADAAYEIAGALKANPGFELYMYPSYGHAAYDTAPDYAKRLYDFFMK